MPYVSVIIAQSISQTKIQNFINGSILEGICLRDLVQSTALKDLPRVSWALWLMVGVPLGQLEHKRGKNINHSFR